MNKMKIEPTLGNVTARLGTILILQNVLIQLAYSAAVLIFMQKWPDPSDTQYVIQSAVEGGIYLFSFMFPVLIFRWSMKKYERQPMRLGINVGIDTVLAIPFGVAVVVTSATLNSAMFSWADTSVLMRGETYDTPVKIMAAFITIALIPAVCEEFLFRGCVLSNLLPFGKSTAVIGSALLFALMHSNPLQFLYAFCAGIVLGLLYLESGSIWPGMFLHLINNFFSVFQETAYAIYPAEQADKIIITLTLTVLLAGIAAGTVLLIRRNGRVVSEESGAVPTFESKFTNTFRDFERPTMVISNLLNIGEGLLVLICLLIY